MAKFKVKAGFEDQGVGLKFVEDIPPEHERPYRTYVLAGIAAVLAKAAVIAQTGDVPAGAQAMLDSSGEDASRILKG
jgi:hypothetical protein